MVGNGLYLPGRIEGNGVSFLVDTESGLSILAAWTWRKLVRAEDELTRYLGGCVRWRDKRSTLGTGHKIELYSGGDWR